MIALLLLAAAPREDITDRAERQVRQAAKGVAAGKGRVSPKAPRNPSVENDPFRDPRAEKEQPAARKVWVRRVCAPDEWTRYRWWRTVKEAAWGIATGIMEAASAVQSSSK